MTLAMVIAVQYDHVRAQACTNAKYPLEPAPFGGSGEWWSENKVSNFYIFDYFYKANLHAYHMVVDDGTSITLDLTDVISSS